VELLAEKPSHAYDVGTPPASSADTPRVVALNYYKNTGRGGGPLCHLVKNTGVQHMSKKRLLALTASSVLFATFMVSSTGALAASGSAAECSAAGGTYTKDGPNSICVFPEQKVSSPNANPNNNAQTTQTTSTGQGNLDNKTQTQCTGNPGHCK
jgi:hypothetical protein